MTGVFRTILLAVVFWLGYKYLRYIIQKLSGTSKSDNSFSRNANRPNVDKEPERPQSKFEGGEYIEYEDLN